MAKFKDITGQKFGRWTVVRYIGRRPDRALSAVYECICECGTVREVYKGNLMHGLSTSCGCRHAEILLACNTTHGFARTPTYKSWCNMIERCTKPANKRYARYGGRGIKVCERWRKFENFLADMGPRPSRKTLDRKNNDGDYEPGNCRWATHIEQSNNRSNNTTLEAHGLRMNIGQWVIHLGISLSTLENRLKRGMPVEIALSSKKNFRWHPANHAGVP